MLNINKLNVGLSKKENIDVIVSGSTKTQICILSEPKKTICEDIIDIQEKLCALSITNIVSSNEQTKEWRKSQSWYKGGKSNECEIYQKQNLENLLKRPLKKCNFRLNTRSKELKEISHPMKKTDGFDWTEDFDGILIDKERTLLFNLKFVCDKGGAQTRTLREVYHFIGAQLEYLLSNTNKNIYFINILEGDTSFNNRDKFNFLIGLEKYEEVLDKVFVGDFLEFASFYKNKYQR